MAVGIVFHCKVIVVSEKPPVAERELADALMEGIVFLDKAANIIWFNRVARRLLGLRDEHVSLPIRDVLQGSGLRRLFSNPDEPITIVRKIGRKNTYLSVSLIQYRDQQLLTLQDVTKQQRAEVMRKDFIGNVSHELRTPLTVFRGYLELLSDQPDALLGQEDSVLNQWLLTHLARKMHHSLLSKSQTLTSPIVIIKVRGVILLLSDCDLQCTFLFSGKHAEVRR